MHQSWAAIFKDSRELCFTLSDVQIQVEGDDAIHAKLIALEDFGAGAAA